MKFRKILAFGATIAGAAVMATSASAEDGGATWNYPVMPVDVCRHQGHFGATTLNPWDPYSLTCYDLSIPGGITFSGGLDYEGYCNAKYPGSHATLQGGDIFSWKCSRWEARSA